MSILTNISNSLITKTKTQSFLSKLTDTYNKDNLKKLTFPSDIETNSTSVYMVIYINENIKNAKSSTITMADGSSLTSKVLDNIKTTKSTISSNYFSSPSVNGNQRMDTAIVLQLPDNALKYSYGAGWEGKETRSAAFIDKVAGKSVDDLRNLEVLKAGANLWKGFKDNISEATKLIYETALGSEGEAYVGATTRQVRNKAVEFLYSAPSPRTFKYDYKLNPRNKNELYNLFNIIKTIKYYSHPEFGKGSGNLSFYNYPAEFDIKFYSNGTENKWIHKTSSLGLIKLEEDLTGEDGNMSFFENHFDSSTGAPPRVVNLSLEFTELSILTRNEIENGF